MNQKSQRPTIFDAQTPIDSISVIMLCKNNESYLPHFFSNMEKIENSYDCKFDYIFVENGSTDKTPSLLRDFIDGRNGYIVVRGNNRALNSLRRTERLAYLRNIAVTSAGKLATDWTLLIDTDIYFDHRILEQLFSKSPTKNKIGMLCAFGMEAMKDLRNGSWHTQQHYFDTSAFLTKKGKISHYPHCIFKNCVKCQNLNLNVERLSDAGLLDAASAFGGAAIVRSSLLNNGSIRWKSENSGGRSMCEHVALCESIETESGLSVAIDCDTKVLWDVSTFKE